MLSDRRYHRRQPHCRHGHPTGSLRNILFFAVRMDCVQLGCILQHPSLCAARRMRPGTASLALCVISVVMVAISMAAARQSSRHLMLVWHCCDTLSPADTRLSPQHWLGAAGSQLPGGAGSIPACAGRTTADGCNHRVRQLHPLRVRTPSLAVCMS